MLIDITELKRTEAALRDSETRLRQAPDGRARDRLRMGPAHRPVATQRQCRGNSRLRAGAGRQRAFATPSWLGFTRRTVPASRRTCTASAPDNPGYSATFRFLHPGRSRGLARGDGRRRVRRGRTLRAPQGRDPRRQRAQAGRGAPEPAHCRARPSRQERARLCLGRRPAQPRRQPLDRRVPASARWPHSLDGQCPRPSEPRPLARRASCRSRAPRAGALGRGGQCHRGGSRHRAHRRCHAVAGDGAPRARDERRQIRRAIDAERARLRAMGPTGERQHFGRIDRGVAGDWTGRRSWLRAERAMAPASSRTSSPTSSAARSTSPSRPTGVRCRIAIPGQMGHRRSTGLCA